MANNKDLATRIASSLREHGEATVHPDIVLHADALARAIVEATSTLHAPGVSNRLLQIHPEDESVYRIDVVTSLARIGAIVGATVALADIKFATVTAFLVALSGLRGLGIRVPAEHAKIVVALASRSERRMHLEELQAELGAAPSTDALEDLGTWGCVKKDDNEIVLVDHVVFRW